MPTSQDKVMYVYMAVKVPGTYTDSIVEDVMREAVRASSFGGKIAVTNINVVQTRGNTNEEAPHN